MRDNNVKSTTIKFTIFQPKTIVNRIGSLNFDLDYNFFGNHYTEIYFKADLDANEYEQLSSRNYYIDTG